MLQIKKGVYILWDYFITRWRNSFRILSHPQISLCYLSSAKRAREQAWHNSCRTLLLSQLADRSLYWNAYPELLVTVSFTLKRICSRISCFYGTYFLLRLVGHVSGDMFWVLAELTFKAWDNSFQGTLSLCVLFSFQKLSIQALLVNTWTGTRHFTMKSGSVVNDVMFQIYLIWSVEKFSKQDMKVSGPWCHGRQK